MERRLIIKAKTNRKRSARRKAGILVAALVTLVYLAGLHTAKAQTKVDLKSQGKNVDFSALSSTKPFKTGTSLPTTCSVGEMFYKTDATPGKNLYACTAAQVWTLQGGDSVPSLTGATDKVLSNNGSVLSWRALAGDVTGKPEAVVVTGIQGQSIASGTPTNGDILQWNSAGNQWTRTQLPVASVFGRTGSVVPQSNDYSFSQVAGKVDNSQLPAAPQFSSVTTGDGTEAGEARYYELQLNGNDYVSWLAPDSLLASLRFRLPAGTPAANSTLQVLDGPDSNRIINLQWGAASLADSGSNGLLKRTAAGVTSVATASDLPVMTGSGSSHSSGAVPDPGATAGSTRYLREDGTWNAPASSSGLADSGANGVLKRTAVGVTGVATASDLPVMTGSGSSHSSGAVPDPGATAGTTRYLREDGTWNAPASSSGLADSGSNGLVKRTALNTTTAATAGTDFLSPHRRGNGHQQDAGERNGIFHLL